MPKKTDFVRPRGRLQLVMADVKMYKKKNYTVKDFSSQRTDRNPRWQPTQYDSVKGCKHYAYHQHDIPNFLAGPPKKQYKKEDVFEIGKDTDKKKSVSKKPKKIIGRKPIKTYYDEFHNFN